ncbi:PAS domain S-box protein [Pseudanabaena sp. FACHB-1998]|uniref:PAS domain-containing protein n=1 Tax=Pseudanabaena sp. FACHB-1998 TaxID=2692858 RepID=UPI001680FD24|nr:PAS domain-containing protein [Pseudanabaena sp. FACHB-1998]MBD2178908.1 PAS domain S-box protein [Pseudanabaena sp. FACHB-1998]
MSLGFKIIYGYAIALGISCLGTVAGLLVGNDIQQQALNLSHEASLQRSFLNTLQIEVLRQRPIQQLSPYLADPIEFRRESDKFLQRNDQILILLKQHIATPKDKSLKGLNNLVAEYEVIIQQLNQESKQTFNRIEILSRNPTPENIVAAELLLVKFAKNPYFLQVTQYLDRFAPFNELAEKYEREADVYLGESKTIRAQILAYSLFLSALTAITFALFANREINRSQAKAYQKLQNQLSEQEQAEEKLRQSEQRYATLAASVPVGIFRTDDQGACIYVNQRCCEIAGLNLDNSLGFSWHQAIHPDDAKQVVLEARRAIAENRPFQMEYRFLRTDGSIIWVLVQTNAEIDTSGQIIGYVGTITDISDRKQTENALRRSESHQRALIKALPDLLIRMNREGLYLEFVSTPNFSILGNLPDQLGNHLSNVLPPIAAQRRLESIYRALSTNSMQIYEQDLSIDDRTQIEEVRIVPYSEDEVLVLVRDISDRKQAQSQLQLLNQSLEVKVQERTAELQARERELQKLSERLQLALRSGAFGSWEWDIANKSVIWDERMYELYGLPLQDSSQLASAWMNVIHPEDRARVKDVVRKTVLGEIECELEFRVVLPDGTIRFIKAYAMVARDSQGNPQTLTGVNFDISDRKRLEQEQIKATRLKDEFLANMSHELRTPLNAIIGITEGLQEQVYGNMNERQIKALKTVERSGSHLLELINDILDVAKIEAGRIELQYTYASINHLCQSSVAFINQQASQKDIQIKIQVQPNLPEIYLDNRRIRQVLINLLNNAVKFTPNRGYIQLEASLVCDPPDDQLPSQYIQIAIIDTGIGIAAENIPKLFQPFVQIDSALNRQYSGTGLGLTLVRQIVELHGGNVSVTSEVGIGSCFVFQLPYKPKEVINDFENPIYQSESSQPINQDAALVTSTLASTNHEVHDRQPLILLVEDNEANVITFSSYLEAHGYRIIFASNGEQAIALTQSHHPDLILMDIQMPVMDGLEATRHIRRDPNSLNIPIIAITALAMEGDREACLDAGANAYLTKPIKLQELAIVMKSFL